MINYRDSYICRTRGSQNIFPELFRLRCLNKIIIYILHPAQLLRNMFSNNYGWHLSNIVIPQFLMCKIIIVALLSWHNYCKVIFFNIKG